jgi:hypothetical protein
LGSALQEIRHGCQRGIRSRQVDDLIAVNDADTASGGPIERSKLHFESVSSAFVEAAAIWM